MLQGEVDCGIELADSCPPFCTHDHQRQSRLVSVSHDVTKYQEVGELDAGKLPVTILRFHGGVYQQLETLDWKSGPCRIRGCARLCEPLCRLTCISITVQGISKYASTIP